MRLNNILIWLAIIALGVMVGGTFYYQDRVPPSEIPPIFRGVTVGNEYIASSTSDLAGTVNDSLYKSGWGALGSLIVTRAGDAEYQLLDVTSSPMTWDAFPTSTYLIAEIPASLAVGTYTFDTILHNGLFLDILGGGYGSTTITFR